MRINLIFFITLISLTAFGQQDDVENVRDPRARERIRAAHAAYITERIGLTADEAEKFWPVYREYLEKRRHLRQEARQGRNSETDESKLLELDLRFKQEELDLEKHYTGEMGRIIPAEKLIKLREAEMDFRKLLLRQIQQRRRR